MTIQEAEELIAETRKEIAESPRRPADSMDAGELDDIVPQYTSRHVAELLEAFDVLIAAWGRP